MDPNACLRRIFEAIEEKDYDEAAAACDDMFGWLKRGGALPTSVAKYAGSSKDFTGFVRVMSNQCLRRCEATFTPQNPMTKR